MRCLGLNCQKLVSKPQSTNATVLGSKFFHMKLHKMLRKTSPYFQSSLQSHEYLFLGSEKKMK